MYLILLEYAKICNKNIINYTTNLPIITILLGRYVK